MMANGYAKAERGLMQKLKEAKERAKKALRAWRLLTIDWRAYSTETTFKSPEDIDLMELLHIDVGPLYLKIKAEANPAYGYIPLMASSSYGQIGALNAESFCERMFSCAGGVMDSGNTLLGPEYLEWLTVLRMNKDFMDFMRFHYPDEAGQEFKMTVARAPDPTEAAEPAFETPTRWDATEQRLEDEHGLGLSAGLAAVYCAPPLDV